MTRSWSPASWQTVQEFSCTVTEWLLFEPRGGRCFFVLLVLRRVLTELTRGGKKFNWSCRLSRRHALSVRGSWSRLRKGLVIARKSLIASKRINVWGNLAALSLIKNKFSAFNRFEEKVLHFRATPTVYLFADHCISVEFRLPCDNKKLWVFANPYTECEWKQVTSGHFEYNQKCLGSVPAWSE